MRDDLRCEVLIMFGYVIVNPKSLEEEQFKLYHSYYCGLCHSLKDLYGLSATKLLSNDMTFLKVVLTGLYEPNNILTKENCVVHPLVKHHSRRNDYDEYAAKMTIILAYYKALDDVNDEGKHQRRLEKLRPLFEEIQKEMPRKVAIIDENLKKINTYEDKNSLNLDLMSKTFGKVLGEIFVYKDDEWADELYTLGDNLGRFIYLMDAYDDVEDDIKKGTYNPFKKRYKDDDFDDYVEKILTLFASEAANAFERMPILTNGEIIRNILYSGIWSRFEAVKAKRKKENEK